MSDEQFKQIMQALTALARQGKVTQDALAELAADVDGLIGQCDTLEVLIHGVNARFDE